MDKEKIICLMLKCYELSNAIAKVEIEADRLDKELHETLAAVFNEYAKQEKDKTTYIKC